jgi:hypothetical protein
MGIADDWLNRIKGTMAIDVDRGISAGADGRRIVEMLLAIPEVSQALHLRANRGSPLALDPSAVDQKCEIVDALARVANWLDDGFHAEIVAELQSIAADLES